MPTHPLLAMARTMGNPVLDERVATLIWQGETAPLLIDDLHNWEDNPQEMMPAGTDLWTISIPLPSDAYFEYAFIDAETGVRLPDPLNPKQIWNGVNAFNHYFYMPRAKPFPLDRPAEGVARGTVTRYSVSTREFAVGAKRSVYLYHPPVKEPVPLVVVYDGADYLRRAKLNVIVDNLIAEKRIRPFAMALAQNGGQARSLEYSCSETTLGFLFECVIPLAQENLTLIPPGGEPYGVIGSSLGGLMALYTGMRMPKIFGKVLSQSGAFGTPEYEFAIVDLIRYAPPPEIDIWMDTGKLEWLLEGNRQIYALLEEKNFRVTYREFSGGHNYTSWANDIWHGLEALFKK